MQKFVSRYVYSCLECQRRKSPSKTSLGTLQSIKPPETPFELVGVDFLGPFPTSRNNKRYVIVAVDYLTRYAETKAVDVADSEVVATFFLNRIVLRHGAPRFLLSDRGRQFISRMTNEVIRLCNSIHRTTTAYHPQCNGLTERFNHTLTDMLAMYVNGSHTNWDSILPFVTFAYNTSRQATSGYPPFQLVYGRTTSTTLDTILPINTTTDQDCTQSFLDAAAEARHIAHNAIISEQQKQTARYNEIHTDVSFNIGDQL
jgi:hypothetical protein